MCLKDAATAVKAEGSRRARAEGIRKLAPEVLPTEPFVPVKLPRGWKVGACALSESAVYDSNGIRSSGESRLPAQPT